MSPSSLSQAIQDPAANAAFLRTLVPQAGKQVVAGLDAFCGRLANALLAFSEHSLDARLANQSFQAGQLLKKNSYAYFHLLSANITRLLNQQLDSLLNLPNPGAAQRSKPADENLGLVSYEDMDRSLALGRVSRAIELHHAQQYAALNMRLAHMLQRETLSIAQNPFRPETFLNAVLDAWIEFEPDQSAHELLLPLLSPELLFDLEALLEELNLQLVKHGVLPDLQESYRLRKKAESLNPRSSEAEAARTADPLDARLRQFFGAASENRSAFAGSSAGSEAPPGSAAAALSEHLNADSASASAAWQQLLELQKSFRMQQFMHHSEDLLKLSAIQQQLPQFTQPAEQRTLGLLSQVFDAVFSNNEIPAPVKQLISLLQIPVLKAALLDKEFFYQHDHPARRLVDLLSSYGLSVDQQQGAADPLLQKMQANVERVAQEFDREISLFEEAISDLEVFMQQQEQHREQALQAPIQRALRQEKIKQANLSANHEVALRIGSGEVVAFIETFLESRWVKVLTLAYTVQKEKPHAIEDALRTMDDLIWSVRPKITLQERQELLNRLPGILARLNKWLSLIKWNDAERVRFFAELSECHASIVRAPLELSPDRQLELAMEAAQQAAERRLEKQAQAERQQMPSSEELEYAAQLEQLQRGVWISLAAGDGSIERLRLAWVSPMRSLFIFTSSRKDHSFSMSDKELLQAIGEQRIQLLDLDHVTEQALDLALDQALDAVPQSGPAAPETAEARQTVSA